jgi:hypothetical protein
MRTERRSAMLGVSVGGVLVGHWLTYRLVAPESHARAQLLRSTGHAYLGLANDAGLVLALVAIAALFLGRLAGGDGMGVGIERRLIMFQAGAFVTMEVLERLTAGDPVAPLLHGWLLPFGVAMQCAVAFAGAWAIRCLFRAADRVASLLARPARAATGGIADAIVPVTWIPRPFPALDAAPVRGPPVRA